MHIHELQGYMLINKPKSITSFQGVQHIRKLLPPKTKIGHAGTLDDFATGLLIMCIGQRATRFSGSIMNIKKEYIVRAKLGELTDSLDYTGTIREISDASSITRADLLRGIAELGTGYEQVPPIYSALKHEGRRLYRLARHQQMTHEQLGEIVDAKKRSVTIYSMNLLEFDPPFFTLQAEVSKGTYVRSLAHDVAQRIGSCATTYELTRTKIGEITLDHAIQLTDITCFEDIENHLISFEAFPILLGISSYSSED